MVKEKMDCLYQCRRLVVSFTNGPKNQQIQSERYVIRADIESETPLSPKWC